VTKETEDAIGMKIVLTIIAALCSGYLGPLAIKLYWNTFLCPVAPVAAIGWLQALMLAVLARCLAMPPSGSDPSKDKTYADHRNEAWGRAIFWGFTIGMWAVLK